MWGLPTTFQLFQPSANNQQPTTTNNTFSFSLTSTPPDDTRTFSKLALFCFQYITHIYIQHYFHQQHQQFCPKLMIILRYLSLLYHVIWIIIMMERGKNKSLGWPKKATTTSSPTTNKAPAVYAFIYPRVTIGPVYLPAKESFWKDNMIYFSYGHIIYYYCRIFRRRVNYLFISAVITLFEQI